MVYQDHLTKFVVLRPLSSKRASEVALQLVDIFTLIGAPVILQSDNGSEFTAFIIRELREIWPELKIVHGKPRHPQSQGSVERANSDIKDMLIAWMTDNKTTGWSLGLRFVQFAKNRSHSAGIGRSPYLAMFGVEPRVGLSSTSLPVDLIDRLQTEDDLQAIACSTASPQAELGPDASVILNETVDGGTEDTTEDFPNNSAAAVVLNELAAGGSVDLMEDLPNEPVGPDVSGLFNKVSAGESYDITDIHTPSPSINTVEDVITVPTDCDAQEVIGVLFPPGNCASGVSTTTVDVHVQSFSAMAENQRALLLLEKRQQEIMSQRQASRECQEKQAERMVKRSRVELCPAEKGDNVAVPIPLVDRGRGDPRNILAVVLDRRDNNTYTLATKHGILKGSYERSGFELCPQKLLDTADLNCDTILSLRETVIRGSQSGGQGYIKCNCAGTKKCRTNRCKCYKSKIKCNSRCHQSLNCHNK
ncbi:hypothetical protein V1264_020587 [Littorina saxatilis]|uniref:Integrase catalytic domain-containing protein n=1 Tax=Littorina saxatilis TaxID=31220 RepID=A0AAN9BAE6_9CAEN